MDSEGSNTEGNSGKRGKSRKKWGKKRFLIYIPLFVLVVFAFYNKAEVTHYEIKSPKIGESVTIALVTDLHCTDYGENQVRLIKSIKAGSPDFILLGGDIFHSFGEREKGFELIRGAAETAPTYFTAGNHEKDNSDYYQLLDEIRQCNATVLTDEAVELQINGNKIILAGGDDAYSMQNRILEGISDFKERDDFKILLNHYPEDERLYADFGFDVMMSGHAHGGEVRLPFFPNGLYAPGQGLFPKYTGGMYEINDKFTLIVSRGLCKAHSAQFRMFNRPELVFVQLTAD
jgi:predicted MPP superfamily phosphohydrolase